MYQERIMDYYRMSRYKGIISPADFSAQVVNSSCGDAIALSGTLQNGRIARCAFEGSGCVISQAAASLLIEHITNASLATVAALSKDTMLTLLGIPLGPTRLRCALIALEAVQKGIASYAQSPCASQGA